MVHGPRWNPADRWRIALACVCAAAAPALAQTAPPPPPPGAIPNAQQLRPAPPLARPESAPAALPAPPRELGKPADEITLDVAAYRVDDSAPAALRAALPALTAPFTGRGRGYEDLVDAAAAVTRFLQRDLGYYLGYAYLPEQSPADGVVRIAVLEGRLDQVILEWPEGLPVKREVVEAYLARLKPGEILQVRDVERVVFLVNDLRGLTARFEVRAGRTPGTAALVVSPQPEARLAQRVELDTLGSRYSGILRASWLGTLNSPAGRGDGLVLNALTSSSGGLRFGVAGYTLPVGSDGFKLGASLSLVRYKLDQELLPLGLNGYGQTATFYGLYPVVRSRNLNLFALVSADAKRYDDRVEVGQSRTLKRVDDLQLSLSGDARDDLLSGGVNTGELSLLGGHLSQPSSTSNPLPAGFVHLRLNLSRLQNLVDNRLLLYLQLKGQYTRRNLDSSEQFQLGGPERVRAFAPGEGTGDSGLQTSLELRLLPPEAWFGRAARELVFSAFVDAGVVRLRAQPLAADDGTDNRHFLSGWGLGAVWDRPNDFALRAYLAWPASGTPTSDRRELSPRFYLTAGKSF